MNLQIVITCNTTECYSKIVHWLPCPAPSDPPCNARYKERRRRGRGGRHARRRGVDGWPAVRGCSRGGRGSGGATGRPGVPRSTAGRLRLPGARRGPHWSSPVLARTVHECAPDAQRSPHRLPHGHRRPTALHPPNTPSEGPTGARQHARIGAGTGHDRRALCFPLHCPGKGGACAPTAQRSVTEHHCSGRHNTPSVVTCANVDPRSILPGDHHHHGRS